ncbi:hypothetical protein DBR47_13460 [Paucibacter sp. KBW04]|uniref:lipopolysaccharide biosynthesis protein n=1 Tax=Paucibacter sp. KBW04 TaxID=2153361 RepID=UPI000F583C25|nr:lipopolysaccharide biosynthesis protein [Paucibacter sp. KBW04]RQO58688.1 hypothetical protein DBR47_13460 [Paucibacter sp. KBW04]
MSVRKALLWSFAERYFSLGITVVSTMVLARLLTPAQVGVFSVCAAFTAIAGILRDFGVSEFLIQEKELTQDKIKAAFGIAIVVAWSIGLIVFCSRSFVASYFAEPGVAKVLAVMSLNFFILPFASPAFALLNREMAFRKIFIVQTVANTVQTVSAITLALNGFSYMSLAWAPVISIACQTLLLSYLRPRDSFLWPSLKNARSVLGFGSMFVSSRVIETLTNNTHEFFIAKQFGFASVGIFSKAAGLMDLFHHNVASAIMRVATPAFAKDHRAGNSLVESYSRGTAILTSLSWPFFGFVAIASGPIIRVLFGPKWDAAAGVATILAVTIMPNAMMNLAPNLLAATGNIKRRLKVTLVYAPIHIVLIALASTISLKAMAAVFGLSNAIMVFLYLRQVSTILQTRIRDILRPCLASLWVALASIGMQALAFEACLLLDLPSLISLIATGVAAVLGWVACARLINHPAYAEVSRLVVDAWNKRQARKKAMP